MGNMLVSKNPIDLLSTKPILKWAGGKSFLSKQIIEFLPKKIGNYIEPFFGGGALFFSLENYETALLSDVNSELVHLYCVVRDCPEELMGALDKYSISYSEKFYYQLRAHVPHDAIEKAARTIFLNKTGFNGLYRQNSKGEFNVPFGKREKCPRLYVRQNLLDVSQKLKRALLMCSDFEGVIDHANQGDVVYCDPPYIPLTQTSSFTSYSLDGFSIEEHVRLRDACVRASKRGAFVMISNSSTAMTADLYGNHFNLNTLKAPRFINAVGNKRGYVEEFLITPKI